MPAPPVLQNQHPGTPPDGQPPPRPDHTRAAVGVALAGFVTIVIVLSGNSAGLAIAPAFMSLGYVIWVIKRHER